MTRETKIGLLVGLAFIIVIGILLSDHLTSSTEPPQAALSSAGNNVRQTIASPGRVSAQLPPITAPINIAPNQPVPTRDELTPGANPVQIVKIGPAASQSNTPIISNNSAVNQDQAQLPDANQSALENPHTAVADANDSSQSNESTGPLITRAPNTAHPLQAIAQQGGEELVDANGRALQTQSSNAASLSAVTSYKARQGDSLSRIAAKFFGADSKSNRDAIAAANPTLKANPNCVVIGRSYKIPAKSAVATATISAPAADAPANDSPVALTPSPKTEPIKLADATPTKSAGTYTVKAGDSLWRIASEQCGKPGAIAALKEINRDILVGENHDQVQTGAMLRLP